MFFKRRNDNEIKSLSNQLYFIEKLLYKILDILEKDTKQAPLVSNNDTNIEYSKEKKKPEFLTVAQASIYKNCDKSRIEAGYIKNYAKNRNPALIKVEELDKIKKSPQRKGNECQKK